MKSNTKGKILKHIQQNGAVRPGDLLNAVNIGESMLYRHLKSLVKDKKIKSVGKSPKTYYVINDVVADSCAGSGSNTNTPQLFDINKFPKQEGLLLFGVSMSKIANIQSPQACYEYMRHLYEKVVFPMVGLNMVYGDGLYLHSSKKAHTLKNKYQNLIHQHKFGFLKLVANKELILKAFTFMTWSQLLLESKHFFNYFTQLKELYDTDTLFKQYVDTDIKNTESATDAENAVNFILEEILMFYLASKGEIRLQNEYVQDKQKWVLWCYPGKPLKSEVYLYQLNPFNLDNPENIYQNSFYDLKEKKLYDYLKIDINTLKT